MHSIKTKKKKTTSMLGVMCIGSSQPASERSKSQIILLWLLCFTQFQNKECCQTISLSYLITNDRPLIPWRLSFRFEAALSNERFTHNTSQKVYSVIFCFPVWSPVTTSELSHNSCYALWPLMTALTSH